MRIDENSTGRAQAVRVYSYCCCRFKTPAHRWRLLPLERLLTDRGVLFSSNSFHLSIVVHIPDCFYGWDARFFPRPRRPHGRFSCAKRSTSSASNRSLPQSRTAIKRPSRTNWCTRWRVTFSRFATSRPVRQLSAPLTFLVFIPILYHNPFCLSRTFFNFFSESLQQRPWNPSTHPPR
jgi:hypothetical protein